MKFVKNSNVFVLLMIGFAVFLFSYAVWAQQAGGAAPAIASPSVASPSVASPSVASPSLPAAPAVGASSSGMPQMTPKQAGAFQSLSPVQQQAIMQEVGKSGGQVTPQAVEALKGRSEFQNLSPEDVAKGKQLLEQKEKGEAQDRPEEDKKKKGKETDDKRFLPWEEKTVISEDADKEFLFTRSRMIGKYQDISLKLKLFGADFFRESAVRVVTDRKDIPVPLQYVIGPGDEVKILMWGRLNTQYNLTVDRDGKITIPNVGPIFVAGKTFEEMSKHLISESQRIVGTNIDISMGSLKTISVFVLGDVRKPGSYTIGSFATITDALVMVGGASDIGSMRKVQLRRNNKLVTTFDLYDLLLKGDKSKDVILQSGDVIFVPVTGPLVGIAGNVKRPAIYELKDKNDLQNLISYAGGIIPTAYTQQIQVERIVKGEQQIVVDINDKHMEKASSFHLQDADLVKIFSIVDANVNAVYLSGNVKRPGKYEYKPGMTIKDLISRTDELLPETHQDYALIKRLKPPSMEPLLIPFNLGKFLYQNDPAHNIALMPQDQVFVFHKMFFIDKLSFRVEGEVRKGGRFELIENFTIKDAILAAGDLTKEAYLKKGELIRVNKQREYSTVYFNVAEALAGKPGANLLLQDEDRVVIHSMWEEKWRENVSIEGEVKNPLGTALMEGMRVSDLVFKAGGVTRDTYLDRAEIYRTDWRTKVVSIQEINLEKAMEGSPDHNLLLKDLDRLVVHSVWENIFKKTVYITGDVHKPGTYQFADGMTVKDLVFAAGNVRESVYLDQAEISSMVVDDGEVAKITVKSVHLGKALAGDAEHNLALKPYDRVFIKQIIDWRREAYANVSGQVKFPGQYILNKGEKLSSVLERAGGYTKEAYLRGAVFTREKVKEMQQKSINEMADRLERDLLSATAAQAATAVSKEEIEGKKLEVEQKKQLIETLRKVKALGRMTIRLAHLRLLKKSGYDFELENGDSLYIPEKSSVVGVVGAVMSQGAYVFSETADYTDYINLSGGYSRFADTANVFILKADGSARKAVRGVLNWSTRNDRMEMAAFSDEDTQYVEPGDVIAVPENFEKIAWLREIRDITQILMNTAVAAGVVIKLF